MPATNTAPTIPPGSVECPTCKGSGKHHKCPEWACNRCAGIKHVPAFSILECEAA